jgi:hypothetical protein
LDAGQDVKTEILFEAVAASMHRACVIAALLASPNLLAGAPVDGKWVAKIQTRKRTQELVLNLKSGGDALRGTINTGRRGRVLDIAEGKINGDSISFTTTARDRPQHQPTTIHWTAKVEGNELKGTRQREGARRGEPFTAIRQELGQ